MFIEQYKENIYAGVLGKMLGVYLGRPVEGWSFDQIDQRFGEVYNFKNHFTGAPLIVPDDDLSGTFTFYRALKDNNYNKELTAEDIGNAWLNYIIENKTILWWGGLSRCSEHTAYIRLKEGIAPPMSGSVELNGASMAEQIGAQIFIDTWALVNPNNPERTAGMARKAASVSHGGIAVEAAVYLAVMESLAFEVKDINKLMDMALDYISNQLLIDLIGEIRAVCAESTDWHEVREWIARNHGYDKYPGSCPMVTNHLVVLMGLLMAGDDFNKSIMIASSAGWDTDCNAGNLGCLNGIRLGLSGLDQGTNLRKAVADRLYVVSADGGSCITDAVLETRKIIKAYAMLNDADTDIPKSRYSFEFPGSVQGFVPYSRYEEEQALTGIENSQSKYGESGLLISYEGLGKGSRAMVCVDTFVDLLPKGKEGTSYFDVLCSPTLYSTQEVYATIMCRDDKNPQFRFFIDYFNEEDEIKTMYGELHTMNYGNNQIRFPVPDTKGHPIYQLGIELTSDKRLDGSMILKSLDWSNEPVRFAMGTSMELTPSLTPWTINTAWLKTFMSSASNFCPDYTTTFSVSHDSNNGVVTTGTSDWKNYAVSSDITFSFQEGAGLVARANGHRQYYGAILTDGYVQIIKRKDADIKVLVKKPYVYNYEDTISVEFILENENLFVHLDGEEVLSCQDWDYKEGGAGYIVNRGCILANKFLVKRV